MSVKMSVKQLSLCLFATAVAQSSNRPKSAVESGDDDGAASANMATGPIGAGIGFAVLFMGMVLYLCKKDRDEKREEEEKRQKELEEAEAGEAKTVGATEAAPEDGQVEIEVEIENRQ